MIIEKAFAKLKGTYNSLIGGVALNSLNILTGAPTYGYSLRYRSSQ